MMFQAKKNFLKKTEIMLKYKFGEVIHNQSTKQ